MGASRPRLAETGRDWPRLAETGRDWPRLAETGREYSIVLGVLSKSGGVPHLRLNIARRPIANKYSDGKMQRTLKRELKVPETDEW